MKKIIYLSLILIISFSTILFAQDFWKKLDGPYGGDLRAMDIDNNGNIYVGIDRILQLSPAMKLRKWFIGIWDRTKVFHLPVNFQFRVSNEKFGLI